MLSASVKWAAGIERNPPERLLDPLTAEVVGSRLMRSLGVGAPEAIERVEPGETPDSREWIVKSFANGRAKFGSDGAERIKIRRIPGTISLTALRNFYNIEAQQLAWNVPMARPLQSFYSLFVCEMVQAGLFSEDAAAADPNLIPDDVLVVNLGNFICRGRDPMPRSFSADFKLPADVSAIKAAISHTSYSRLLVHAARAFLLASTAHSGNILINSEAKLFSIDHEFIVAAPESEGLDHLRGVKRGTAAHRALQAVAAVDVEKVFAGFECAEFYARRHALWKEL